MKKIFALFLGVTLFFITATATQAQTITALQQKVKKLAARVNITFAAMSGHISRLL